MLLQLSTVPKQRPQESSFVMYYSQKVGKWDRRHITIREDGQVVARKSSSDRDATNMCHLSDFDIYTPTPRQMSKKIKPPKKICFAIKSLEKTSMFESTTNFVHFLCTGDKFEGINFYTAVQSWRSWYLVNVKGEGKKQSKPVEPASKPIYSVQSPNHHPSSSIDSHYQTGSFKPIDVSGVNGRPISSQGPQNNQSPVRKASVRDKKNPPVSLSRNVQLSDDEPLVNLLDKQQPPLDGGARDSGTGTFASSGLLGRSYSQRQRAQQEREAAAQQPFTNGQSLAPPSEAPRRTTSTRQSGAAIGRTASVRDADAHPRTSIDLARSTSRRDKAPAPLVDLTPTYQPPPQHVKKGKGFKPDEIGPGGLIENATSPENAIEVPPAVDWRGRNEVRTRTPPSTGTANGSAGGGGNGAVRSGSQTRNGSGRARSTSRSAAPGGSTRFHNSQAYAALHGATSSRSRDRENERSVSGGGARRTVTPTGGSGNGPLVDLSEESQFVKGSLLERVQRGEVA